MRISAVCIANFLWQSLFIQAYTAGLTDTCTHGMYNIIASSEEQFKDLKLMMTLFFPHP